LPRDERDLPAAADRRLHARDQLALPPLAGARPASDRAAAEPEEHEAETGCRALASSSQHPLDLEVRRRRPAIQRRVERRAIRVRQGGTGSDPASPASSCDEGNRLLHLRPAHAAVAVLDLHFKPPVTVDLLAASVW